VGQSPLVEAWEAERHSHFYKSSKSSCSNAELVVRQSLASKDMNTDSACLGAVTRQLVKTQ
jgi:hypothetical protein